MGPLDDMVKAVAAAIGIDAAELARRKAFLEFDPGEVEQLKALHEHLASLSGPFLDAFYAHLGAFEETRALIADPAVVERLKRSQQAYFESLTSGGDGDDYVANRVRIGLVHRSAGLDPKWYIGAYGKYLSTLLPEIWRIAGRNPHAAAAAGNALIKAVLLDMGLTIDTYVYAKFQTVERLKRAIEKVLGSVPLGTVVLSAELVVLSSNRLFREIVGGSDQNLRGRALDEILPRTRWWEELAKMLSAEGARHELVVNYTRGEEDRILRVVMTAIERTEDDKARVLLTVEDITVRKRTEDALKKAYDDLKDAQGQVIQAEKMSSLGQLAAGVAHEINNPIGYVNSNLRTLGEYVEDLLQVVGGYEGLQVAVESGDAEAARAEAARARALAQRVDTGFLLQDISRLVAQSCEGVDRVQRIVQNLKTFSHVDQAERTLVNVHEGIENTLAIVWNELKYKAEVIKELGPVPQIVGYPQQLNQVFVNLLVNAAHAITSKGTIWIRTFVRKDQVVVEVEDTGSGIAPEHIKKIFDPFFTTKPVGKGTGLGLSISYGIVQKHGGTIEVDSEVGRGTRFRVVLPMEGAHAQPAAEPPQDRAA